MIGTATYRHITEVLAEIQDLGDLALEGLLCSRDALFAADVNPRERFRRELFAMMDNTYSFIALKHIRANTSLLNMTKALNDHVLDFYGDLYGYTTIDEFLNDQYLEVPTSFASLSNFIGYGITSIGDKSAKWEDIGDNWQDVDIGFNLIGWENI